MTSQFVLAAAIIIILCAFVTHYLYLRRKHISRFRGTRTTFDLVSKRHIMDEGEKTLHSLEHQIEKWGRSVQRIYLGRYHEITQIIREEARETMKILDIGCYDCYLFEQIIDTTDLSENNLYGLDLSRSRLSLARQRLSNVNLVQGDAENLPWQSGGFDMVICSETLEHLLDPVGAVAEMKRVLADYGLLILTVPSKHTKFISYLNPVTWLEAMVSVRHPSILPPFHNLYRPHNEDTVVHRAFSFSELEALFKAGWHDTKMGSLGFLPELLVFTPELADRVRRLLKKIPILNKLGATIIVTARSEQYDGEAIHV